LASDCDAAVVVVVLADSALAIVVVVLADSTLAVVVVVDGFAVVAVVDGDELDAPSPDEPPAEGPVPLGGVWSEPLLAVDRVAYTFADRPVEWRRGLCATRHHHYLNELQ